MYTSKTLASAFSERPKFFSNRASTVFPIYFTNQNSDLILSFVNYWKLKDDIHPVSCNIRVFNADGTNLRRESFEVERLNNAISLRDFVEETTFEGMVELEIVSSKNIRFVFPAITAFFKYGDFYSAVHSVGRIKNADEVKKTYQSHESNWTLKTDNGFTPFAHIFNGASQIDHPAPTIELRDSSNNIVASKELDKTLNAPYQSEMILFDKLFSKEDLAKSQHARVSVWATDVFPRLVVGNYNYDFDFLEVTHSYPVIDKQDFVPENKDLELKSFLPMVKPSELDLKVSLFPTNCESSYKGILLKENQEPEPIELNTGYKTGAPFQRQMPSDSNFECITFTGDNIPSRLNANYIYEVKNSKVPCSTDIATGAKSWVYPKKFRHWGAGLIDNSWETIVVFRNFSYLGTTEDNKGEITVYFGDDESITAPITVPGNGAESISLKDIFTEQQIEKMAHNHVSWFATFEKPYIETFWVSKTKDGHICGEHGF